MSLCPGRRKCARRGRCIVGFGSAFTPKWGMLPPPRGLYPTPGALGDEDKPGLSHLPVWYVRRSGTAPTPHLPYHCPEFMGTVASMSPGFGGPWSGGVQGSSGDSISVAVLSQGAGDSCGTPPLPASHGHPLCHPQPWGYEAESGPATPSLGDRGSGCSCPAWGQLCGQRGQHLLASRTTEGTSLGHLSIG